MRGYIELTKKDECFSVRGVICLEGEEIFALSGAFSDWCDKESRDEGGRSELGKYVLTYYVQKATGAELSEVACIDDIEDIDFTGHQITIKSRCHEANKVTPRRVQVNYGITKIIEIYLEQFPYMRGDVFNISMDRYTKIFCDLAKEVGISKERAYPGVLRETKITQLLLNNIPKDKLEATMGISIPQNVSMHGFDSVYAANNIIRKIFGTGMLDEFYEQIFDKYSRIDLWKKRPFSS